MTLIKQITPECQPVFPCWLWFPPQQCWFFHPDNEGCERLTSGWWHPDWPAPPTEVPEAAQKPVTFREIAETAAEKFCVLTKQADSTQERLTDIIEEALRVASAIQSIPTTPEQVREYKNRLSAAPQATGGTPETDALEDRLCNSKTSNFSAYAEMIGLARQLEIQRDEARREVERVTKALPRIMESQRDGWTEVRRLDGVIATLRAENEQLRKQNDQRIADFLAEKVCCNGHECGCGGVTRLQQYIQEEAGSQITSLRADLEKAKAELAGTRRAFTREFIAKNEAQDALSAANAQLAEARDKLTAQVLFNALGERLLKRVFEAADMSLPDATDAELSLVRIISERDDLRQQLALAREDRERRDEEAYWRGYKARVNESLVEQPEPAHPSLWKYLYEAFAKNVTFHSIGVSRMQDGGFHFYIHPQNVSGETEDFLLWPDPFNRSDMLVNKKASPPPDVEKFKAFLARDAARGNGGDAK